MADEVRIHLSTYLKDAGIKATRQQIDKLAQDVKKINNDVKSGTDEAVGSLGKLPGAFGKIQGVIGGLGAKALSVIAAFKVGWDIGAWLREKFIFPLLKIKDPIEELKKHNQELKMQCEAAAKAWEDRWAKMAAGWDAEAKSVQRAVKHVDDLTRAYLQLQQAREQVASAGNDAEMLALRRDKFNAMANAATPEEAAALGKEHDVRIAEAAARQKLGQYDREAESRAEQLSAEEEKLRIATRHVNRVNAAVANAEKKLAYLESDQSAYDMGWKAAAAEEDKMRARLEKLKEERRSAEAEEDRQRRTVEAARVAATADPQMRQNIIDAAQLEIDEKKKAYDDYVAQIEREDAQRAEEAAQREQEEIEREAQKREAEMQRLVAEEQRERERMEQQLAAQRIADLRSELSERQRAEKEAQSRQAAAAGSLSTAWGWYRNQNQMQAVIDERKAQAAAEAQWAKDFERLKTWRSDWRTAEFGSLSAADEAVRQVAFAKEEKAAADRAVIETAENTRDLAEKLDELLQVKG